MRNKKTIASSIKIISKKETGIALAALMTVSVIPVFYPFAITTASAANIYQNSDFIETEQPELDAETKQLISLYQKVPSEENYNNLRNKVIENYDAVIAKKEAKLAELKAETEGKPSGEDNYPVNYVSFDDASAYCKWLTSNDNGLQQKATVIILLPTMLYTV